LQQFHRDADRWKDEEVRRSHQVVELLSAAALPHAGSFGTLSFWATEPNNTANDRFRGWSFPHNLGVLLSPEIKLQIKLQISDPLPPIDEQITEYFQINGVWGAEPYYSFSLRNR